MIIHKKPNSANIVWDNEKGQPLLIFKGGIFITKDKAVADKAKSLGYEVEADAEVEKAEADVTEEKPKKTATKKKTGA